MGFPAALTGGGDQVGTVVHVERGTAVPLLECFVDRRFRLHRADFEAVYALGDGGGPGENLPYPFQMEAGGVGEKDRPDPVSRQSGNQFAHTRHRCGDDRAERFKHRLLVQLRSGLFPESFKILVRGEPSLFHLVIQHEQFPRHFRRRTVAQLCKAEFAAHLHANLSDIQRNHFPVHPVSLRIDIGYFITFFLKTPVAFLHFAPWGKGTRFTFYDLRAPLKIGRAGWKMCFAPHGRNLARGWLSLSSAICRITVPAAIRVFFGRTNWGRFRYSS